MAKIYTEQDADLDLLKEKKIAVLGFGSQGHAHAMNLKESGCRVMVIEKDMRKQQQARDFGIEVVEIRKGVSEADILMILAPDENQADIFNRDIRDNLAAGKMLMFAHGFSIHFSQVVPPDDVDVTMIAPKCPGHMVRREFVGQRGVPALIAVYRDYSGHAKQLALAYAKGIGCTRAGVFETSFQEECETDLFGEQAVLCGGITSLMKAGFETLVEAGYQPEMAYFECINEMKLIVDLIYEGGFSFMRYSVSNTAEYGDYITQGKLVTEETKKTMRKMLVDIQSGRFAREWILENQAGRPSYGAMKRRENGHQLEKIGEKLRRMMPWLKNKNKNR
ncbi:MAG: ketol-acid reductoisomerase [Candidatus Aminicenantes bacterium]|nr:ketol-acid reductoisomerase [Candidatus Aminicenantes bacterium]